LVVKAHSRDFSEAILAMNDPILPLPGLSPAGGKVVVVKFDGGLLSSDGGVLALREVERRLRVADRLAACMIDPRAPDQITHSLADIIRFRLLMIAAASRNSSTAPKAGAASSGSSPASKSARKGPTPVSSSPI
jgi:Transposase DDE domain group 1